MNRKNSETRKREAIKATLELLGEEGVEGLTIAAIAEKVGFSEAALYKHFSGKLDVVGATIDYVEEEMESLWESFGEEGTAIGKLRGLLQAQLTQIEREPGMARLLFSEEVHFNDQKLRRKLLALVNKRRQAARELIEEGIKNGEFDRELDPKAAAELYLGLVQSRVFLWSLREGKLDLKEEADSVWKVFKRLCSEK